MTVRSLRARFALVAACVWTALFASLPQPVAAQVTSASVAGTIRDAQGAVIPGATITLTSVTRGTVFTAVSTGEGDFTFPTVEADTYGLRVTMDGFKTAERANIVTHPGDRLALGVITIEVGAVTETISVAARATELQTQSAERNYVVEGEAVKNIAQNGRSFFGLAFLAPGVVSTQNTGVPTGDSATMSANGQRTNSNNVQIDGITDMDTGNNGGPMVALSLDSVQEVKLLTSNYQAEYGRSAGAQLTAVTKSGGREFHGSAYWFRRQDDLNANTWINNKANPKVPVPKLNQRDLGYTIGGPIMLPGKGADSTKLFFFWSQEYQSRLNPQTTPQRVRVPTALERQGDFSQTRDAAGNLFPYVRDYTTGLPCSASDTRGCFQDGGVLGKISQNRLYQLGLNVLNVFPAENSPGTITQGFNYVTQDPTSQPERQDLLRLDWNATDALRINGKILNDKSNRLLPYGSFVLGTNMPPYAATYLFPRRGYSLGASATLNNSTFIEATYGYSHNSIDILPGVGNEKNFTRAGLGLTGFPTLFPDAVQMDFPPRFNWGGGRISTNPSYTPNIGTNNAPFTNFNTTMDGTGSITKLWGKHTAKAGLYYHHSLKPQSSFANANGDISFGTDASNSFDTGFPFANAATGIYTTYNQASGYFIGNYVYNNVEWYVQDNFKATNRLTLDYGLRFYWIQPQYDTKSQTANFLPDKYDPSKAMRLYYPRIVNGQKVAMDLATGQTVDASNVGRLVPGSGTLLNGVYQAGQGIEQGLYKNRGIQYAPRFGFTYDLTGQQAYIMRGGAGIFYDRPQGNTVFDLLGNPPTTLAPTLNNGRLQDLQGGSSLILAPPSITAFDHEGKVPTVYAYNLGVQVKIPLDAVLDISYVGSQSRHLLQRRNINAAPYGAAYLPQNQDPTAAASTVPGATALPIDFLRPYQGFGNILLIEPVANSNYNSLQTSVNRRFKNGLLMAVSYTWGKALGTVNNDLPGTGAVASPRNVDNNLVNYAPLDFDRRNQFIANFVYELPHVNKGGVVGGIVNNWQLSGIYRIESGQPYTIGYNIPGISAYTLTGQSAGAQGLENARVVIKGDPGPGYNNSDPYRMFDTSVFAPPQPGSTGTESSRNYLNRAYTNNLDLSVAKRFPLGGNRRLELRIDAFNALNHTQFLDINTTMNVRSLTDPTITNLPYDAAGNLVNPTGFGAVTNTRPPRQVQLLMRFQF